MKSELKRKKITDIFSMGIHCRSRLCNFSQCRRLMGLVFSRSGYSIIRVNGLLAYKPNCTSNRHFSRNRLLAENITSVSNAATVGKQRTGVTGVSEYGREMYLKVVGSGARGTARSLIASCRKKGCLFNCGDSTQRLIREHHLGGIDVKHIFITHKSWNNIGGLFGYTTSLRDKTTLSEIYVHGPPGLELFIDDSSDFFFKTPVGVEAAKIHVQQYTDYEEDIALPDENLFIHTVPLYSEDPINIVASDTKGNSVKYFCKEAIYKQKKYSWDDASGQRFQESLHSRNLALAYICQTPEMKGRLLLEECVKANIPPGPHLLHLKNGFDITLEDGRKIKACDVSSPDYPSSFFIVVEAPSVGYLDSLLESKAFAPHQSAATEEDSIAEAVVHFTPSHVLANPLYQEWMSRFPRTTVHFVVNDKNRCLGCVGAHKLQHQLNHICSTVFPSLSDKSIPISKVAVETGGETVEGICSSVKENACYSGASETFQETLEPLKSEECDSRVHTQNSGDMSELKSSISKVVNDCQDPFDYLGRGDDSGVASGPVYQTTTLQTFHFRSDLNVTRDPLLITPSEYIREMYKVNEMESLLQNLQENLAKTRKTLPGSVRQYPVFTFLGTGGRRVEKYRSNSAILLHLSEEKAMLLDCGEGAYNQMVRLYGLQKSEEILRHLVGIYISHLHIDHHTGLIDIILRRKEAFKKIGVNKVPSLLLMAPGDTAYYLSSFHFHFENIMDSFTLLSNQHLMKIRKYGNIELEKICQKLDMADIDIFYVPHCRNSFGVVLTHKDRWKVTYSGDTKPTNKLAERGKYSDLLIHEATLEDGFEALALEKSHSTTSQAIEIGKAMKARYIILTHFSQRYAKVPVLGDNVPENVGIAYDNMEVTFADLPYLHLLYPVFLKAFEEDFLQTKSRFDVWQRKQAFWNTDV